MKKQLKHIVVNINDLKPAAYNPREELRPGDPEYENIKNSIQEFGYADAIVVNKDLTVIGGHQRLNVLKDLGYSDIEVAQVDLTKKQEKALNIALNKITGRWDDKKLTDLFKDLNSDSFKLNLTGFNDEELSSILNSHDSRNSQDDTSDNRENERMNTVRQYNLQIYDPYDVDGFYNMPVIVMNDEHASITAPQETMTRGRVYVTVDTKKDMPAYITYYGNDLKKSKSIDLLIPHSGVLPHVHHGLDHRKNDQPKGYANLTTEEKRMVERVNKLWQDYLARR